MKVKDLFPEVSQFLKANTRVGELANFLDIQKSGETFTSPTIGTDQLVSVWMRQSQVMPYRRQLLADLYYIATSVSEVRAPIQHITSEVFRRGIQWRAAFSSKCNQCGTKFQESVEICKECESKDLSGPDEKQRERLEKFFDDANIFDNSLKEILKVFNFNLAAIDDAFLYLSKEYYGDEATGKVRSKIIEIRNIHPADIEFDLDINGLPKNSHFSCYIHRDFHAPNTEPGFCEECGRNLIPAMYILSNRGKKFYLFDSEVIKVSRMMPNELYGISPILTIMFKALTIIGMDTNVYRYFYERRMPACYDEKTEVLTNNGWKFWRDVLENDEFMTIDEDKNILYEKPNKLYEYDYLGKMYSIKNHYIDLLVTPNHRMMVKKQDGKNGKFFTITADKAKGKKLYHLRGGVKWDGQDVEHFTLDEDKYYNGYINEIDLPMEDWMKFLGCWYAVGHIRNGNRVVLSSGKDNVYSNYINNIISLINLNWKNNDGKISACSIQLYDWLSDYKLDKLKLLKYIANLPYKYQKIFIEVASLFLNIQVRYKSKNKKILLDSITNFNSINYYDNSDMRFRLEKFNKSVYRESLNIPIEDWLKFLGYYLSEGSVRKSEVTIAQKKEYSREIIYNDLIKLPFKWRISKDGFICNDIRLAKYLKQFGYSKDRFIPRELLNLSKDRLKILLDAWILGDTDCTSSPRLRDDLMEIAIKLGMAVSYRTIKYPDHPEYNNMYYIGFAKKTLNAGVNVNNIEDKWIDYSGKVYCAEIPHGNLLVRRNGKTVWSKNSMIMVFTDDPDSLRRERENIRIQTRQDPNYIPMVAVSSRGQRGRVDMVRLFHTLQEMEYLPIRQEIRERIAEMWGVTPIWSSSAEAVGGISSSTQQLTVMSRVVEGFQEVYHDKVFPQLLKAFGITDWLLFLPNPEEKSEQTRIAFAQQRVAIAQQLNSMGFNIEIKSSRSSVDEIDFVVSGKPLNPQQAMFGAGQEAAPPPLALSEKKADTKQRGWINQIVAYGHVAPEFKYVNNDGTKLYYNYGNKDYVASFDDVGALSSIQEFTMQRPVQTQPVKIVYRDKQPDVETIVDDEDEQKWENT